MKALERVRNDAERLGDHQSAAAAMAVAAAACAVKPADIFFRVHPKGVGLVCTRNGGLPPFSFINEYYGELHAPWQWFEIQVNLISQCFS